MMAIIKTPADFARLVDQTAIHLTGGDGWAAIDLDEVLQYLYDAGRIHHMYLNPWEVRGHEEHRVTGVDVDGTIKVAITEARQGSPSEGYDYSAPMYFVGKSKTVSYEIVVPDTPVVFPGDEENSDDGSSAV